MCYSKVQIVLLERTSNNLQEECSNKEALTLTIAYLAVIHTESSKSKHFLSLELANRWLPVSFADPEQGLLSRPTSLFEELMCWKGSMDVPEYYLKLRVQHVHSKFKYHLLIRSLLGDQDAVVFDGILHLLACPAQPLPHFSPEQKIAMMIPKIAMMIPFKSLK